MLAAQNISKRYKLYAKPSDRIREALPFAQPKHEDFWALRDVNLEVGRGETLGIVGPNGGGKSTLLQILCGILEPTTGRVVRKGRVAALLELGAGFNPEFSGRENIYLNGEIMGRTRAQTDAVMESIERFAGIGPFLERPVKTYSSGMHVRLAFAAAIHVEPDILIVDEALAVGDAVFANRCVRKFQELQESGVTIVFVSHDLGLVKQVCDRAIYMQDGRVQIEGEPAKVINRYVGAVLEKQRAWAAEAPQEKTNGLAPSNRHGDRIGEVMDVELLDAEGKPTRALMSGDAVTVRIRSHFHGEQPEPMVGILIRTRTGLEVFGTNTKVEETPLPPCAAGDTVEVEFRFECRLTPQEYTLTVATQHPSGHSHDWLDDAIAFRVLDAKARAGVANLETEVRVSAVQAEG
ncbi:MAG: ABC transporter ATP-binding protein [Bryobacterales bacterium]|nr:ABC transporter ATP-binding protein [Acidobacteriota bacterium]MCB9384739.1 ABC transporter ATP-binding protein [Bryobacterales bacterium]